MISTNIFFLQMSDWYLLARVSLKTFKYRKTCFAKQLALIAASCFSCTEVIAQQTANHTLLKLTLCCHYLV